MAKDSNLMGWDDTVQVDSEEYYQLPEGDYVFHVIEFERGSYPGGAKIPACNKASLKLEVITPEGTARVKTDLLLYRTLEWKISAFFRCIGQKKKGEPLRMDWGKVIGSRGYAHFKPRTYTGNDGKEHTAVDCDKFYDYDPAKIDQVRQADFEAGADDPDFLPW